ncbi:TolC family protein [Flavobacterium gawalongense]|uniref:TolC family protein n=1 Tax=Flavobacterium gawalongense TaxID=2594432 RepID=A0A553BX17_9FLAO|nr:TolC family protein [Flavobacterium gawalongense]TRX04236.1 TolC family protein [Flavobacterium gawalongense]TRX09314.1 TolC family protein [Flavobacterium gawalongense]TRX12872.1 TolC family protein [Flavobacterium gawalongense]TRX13217.1 TolC family protein [Flavobacterium gawalongense]TRX30721.1 TolC family protein [Flavobacterium gawalongense]
MKKRSFFSLILMLVCSITIQAQSKNWTLEECIKYAIQNNISIKQTELDSKTAAIDKKGAIGNFLPSLNANASHSWNIGLNQDITTGLLRNQTTQFTSAGANVGVDIYKGLQNQNNLRKANLSIVAAKYQLLKMQEDVALNVANSFLQVLFNKENLKVQKEQLAINEKQYARSQELVNAGSIPRGDLLDIKATVASNNQNVIAADNAVLISKLSLAQLLQLKDFENFDIIDGTSAKDENNILAQTPTVIYDKAKEGRTELKIAKTNLEIAEKNVAIAKGAFQPTLQGFYSFNSRVSYADVPQYDPITGTIIGAQKPDPFWTQFSDNKGQSFGAQLSIPIFNGFSAKNNVERSKVSLEKSKIALEQQELDLQRNVYTAFTDAKGALNAHESSVVALESRQEAYNYAKEKYAVGLMNSFDFNQSQTLLTNAQSEVLRTKYDYIFKIKILEFYFGIPIIKN